MHTKSIPVRQRITTRGEGFLETNIINNSDVSHLLGVEGISKLVKGQPFAFDTKIGREIKPVNQTIQNLWLIHKAAIKNQSYISTHILEIQ